MSHCVIGKDKQNKRHLCLLMRQQNVFIVPPLLPQEASVNPLCHPPSVDNILDDKPEAKSSADKEEQTVDEMPKRLKKPDSATQSKGKVRI